MRMHGSIERRIRREARSETLRERALALREAGWTLQAIAVALGVSSTLAQQIVRKSERLVRYPHWYDPLPMRAQNYLRASGLAALSEVEAARAVARMSRREFLTIPNIGHGAFAAISTWLAGHGLAFLPPTMSRKKLAAVEGTAAKNECLPLRHERPERCEATPATSSRQYR